MGGKAVWVDGADEQELVAIDAKEPRELSRGTEVVISSAKARGEIELGRDAKKASISKRWAAST